MKTRIETLLRAATGAASDIRVNQGGLLGLLEGDFRTKFNSFKTGWPPSTPVHISETIGPNNTSSDTEISTADIVALRKFILDKVAPHMISEIKDTDHAKLKALVDTRDVDAFRQAFKDNFVGATADVTAETLPPEQITALRKQALEKLLPLKIDAVDAGNVRQLIALHETKDGDDAAFRIALVTANFLAGTAVLTAETLPSLKIAQLRTKVAERIKLHQKKSVADGFAPLDATAGEIKAIAKLAGPPELLAYVKTQATFGIQGDPEILTADALPAAEMIKKAQKLVIEAAINEMKNNDERLVALAKAATPTAAAAHINDGGNQAVYGINGGPPFPEAAAGEMIKLAQKKVISAKLLAMDNNNPIALALALAVDANAAAAIINNPENKTALGIEGGAPFPATEAAALIKIAQSKAVAHFFSRMDGKSEALKTIANKSTGAAGMLEVVKARRADFGINPTSDFLAADDMPRDAVKTAQKKVIAAKIAEMKDDDVRLLAFAKTTEEAKATTEINGHKAVYGIELGSDLPQTEAVELRLVAQKKVITFKITEMESDNARLLALARSPDEGRTAAEINAQKDTYGIEGGADVPEGDTVELRVAAQKKVIAFQIAEIKDDHDVRLLALAKASDEEKAATEINNNKRKYGIEDGADLPPAAAREMLRIAQKKVVTAAITAMTMGTNRDFLLALSAKPTSAAALEELKRHKDACGIEGGADVLQEADMLAFVKIAQQKVVAAQFEEMKATPERLKALAKKDSPAAALTYVKETAAFGISGGLATLVEIDLPTDMIKTAQKRVVTAKFAEMVEAKEVPAELKALAKKASDAEVLAYVKATEAFEIRGGQNLLEEGDLPAAMLKTAQKRVVTAKFVEMVEAKEVPAELKALAKKASDTEVLAYVKATEAFEIRGGRELLEEGDLPAAMLKTAQKRVVAAKFAEMVEAKEVPAELKALAKKASDAEVLAYVKATEAFEIRGGQNLLEEGDLPAAMLKTAQKRVVTAKFVEMVEAKEVPAELKALAKKASDAEVLAYVKATEAFEIRGGRELLEEGDLPAAMLKTAQKRVVTAKFAEMVEAKEVPAELKALAKIASDAEVLAYVKATEAFEIRGGQNLLAPGDLPTDMLRTAQKRVVADIFSKLTADSPQLQEIARRNTEAEVLAYIKSEPAFGINGAADVLQVTDLPLHAIKTAREKVINKAVEDAAPSTIERMKAQTVYSRGVELKGDLADLKQQVLLEAQIEKIKTTDKTKLVQLLVASPNATKNLQPEKITALLTDLHDPVLDSEDIKKKIKTQLDVGDAVINNGDTTALITGIADRNKAARAAFKKCFEQEVSFKSGDAASGKFTTCLGIANNENELKCITKAASETLGGVPPSVAHTVPSAGLKGKIAFAVMPPFIPDTSASSASAAPGTPPSSPSVYKNQVQAITTFFRNFEQDYSLGPEATPSAPARSPFCLRGTWTVSALLQAMECCLANGKDFVLGDTASKLLIKNDSGGPIIEITGRQSLPEVLKNLKDLPGQTSGFMKTTTPFGATINTLKGMIEDQNTINKNKGSPTKPGTKSPKDKVVDKHSASLNKKIDVLIKAPLSYSIDAQLTGLSRYDIFRARAAAELSLSAHAEMISGAASAPSSSPPPSPSTSSR